MTKIFEKLKSPDILRVAEVCRHWYNITQNQSVVNKTNMHLSQSKALNCFIKSKRKLNFCLKINSKLPTKFDQFSDKFAANITEIMFVEIKFQNYYDFIANLTNLKQMTTLKIINCSFKGEGCLISPKNLNLNITELFLMNNGKCGMKDWEISHLLSITINLIKFSCDVTEYNDSGKTICDYLINPELTKSLKELKIFGIKSSLLCNFFRSKHLDLEMFYWKTYNIVRCVKDIETFLISQRNLKIMNFYFFPGYFKDICSSINFKELPEDLMVVNSWNDFYSHKTF